MIYLRTMPTDMFYLNILKVRKLFFSLWHKPLQAQNSEFPMEVRPMAIRKKGTFY